MGSRGEARHHPFGHTRANVLGNIGHELPPSQTTAGPAAADLVQSRTPNIAFRSPPGGYPSEIRDWSRGPLRVSRVRRVKRFVVQGSVRGGGDARRQRSKGWRIFTLGGLRPGRRVDPTQAEFRTWKRLELIVLQNFTNVRGIFSTTRIVSRRLFEAPLPRAWRLCFTRYHTASIRRE